MFLSSAIGGAIAAASGLAWLGTVAAGVVQAAIGVGLSLIAQAISGQGQQSRAFSMQVQLRSGDDQPRSLNFGWNVTGGTLVYASTWGPSNRYLTQAIALGDMPIRELRRVFVDGKPVTLLPPGGPGINNPYFLDFGNPVSEYRKTVALLANIDHMWVKFFDGTQTSADPFLTGKVSTTDRPFDSGRVGRGVPYIVVTCMAPQRADGEDKPLFQGVPSFKFETYGLRLYDISRDTSAGGSGPQRYDDPSTWGGDGDFLPAVQAYNVLRGIRYNGQWLYGLQDLHPSRLPAVNWIEAINKCRQAINTTGTGTEPQYRSGGELTVDTPIADVLDSLMAACQGRIVEVGGSYKCFVGEPGSPVYAFSDDDVLSTEDQYFTPFFSLADSVNGVAVTWPNPAEAWNRKSAKPYLRPDLEALDGNRRLLASIQLDMVPYGGQVQRLQKSAILEAQRARRHTLTLGPSAWRLEPGDVVAWTSARNGYVNKLFRVEGLGDLANLNILVDLTEVDPSDYDWTPATDYTPIIDGPVNIISPPPLAITSFAVYPAIIYDELGRPRKPSIEVHYDSGMVDVYSVRIQVRTAGETEPFYDAETPYGTPFSVILPGQFSSDTAYEVRAIYVRESGMNSDWTGWFAVTTPDVKLIPGVDFDPYEGTVGFDQLEDDLAGWVEWIGQTPRELIEAIQNVDTHVADQEASNALTFEEVRTEMALSLDSVEASFQQVITLAIVPLQGEVAALADWLTELSAGDGEDVSTARFRMTTLSGPTGYSRIGAETRIDSSDDWRGAAWYLDTPNAPGQPTRFTVNADQFVVVSNDDSAYENPLIFDSSGLRLNVANIGTVNAGVIQGNQVLINLNTGFFSFG